MAILASEETLSIIKSSRQLSAEEREAQLEFVHHALTETETFERLCGHLERSVKKAHAQPLFIDAQCGDPSINHKVYTDAQLDLDACPLESPEGYSLIRDVTYGYNVDGDKRRVGTLGALLVNDQSGKIEKVYAPSKEAFDEFLIHIRTGVITSDIFQLSPKLSRIAELNSQLVCDLRNHPPFKAQLDAFIESREFDPKWGEDAKLAYFSSEPEFDFDLKTWALLNDYTQEEMYLSGWMDKRISNSGEVTYSPSYSDIVIIPFIDEELGAVSWRMRVVNPAPGDPKYRDQPYRREFTLDIPDSLKVAREMYGADNLAHAQGKRIFITEGEFKGLVTQEITDTLATCITGITLISDEMIKAWVASDPDEIVICLDRDPLLMALERIDGIPDSQRAAYLLARRLIRAGAKNVKIAELPDILNGEKVGVDDYLLLDRDKSKERFENLVSEARTAEEFEKHFNVDIPLQDLYERRTRLIGTYEKMQRVVARGFGTHLCEQSLQELERQRQLIDTAYHTHLGVHYSDARSISRPHPSLHPLGALKGAMIQGAPIKSIVDSEGNAIAHTRCVAPIATITVLPRDAHRMGQGKGKLGAMSQRMKHDDPAKPPEKLGTHTIEDIMDGALKAPVGWRQLRRVWTSCRANVKGQKARPLASFEEVGEKVKRDFHDGVRIAFPDLVHFTPEEIVKKLSYREFNLAYLVGFVSRIAPPDTYNFHTNVQFKMHREDYTDVVATAQLALTSKKSGMLKAIIYFPIWQEDQDLKNAIWEMATVRGSVRNFLREPSLLKQQDSYTTIASIFWEVIGNKRIRQTQLLLDHLDISEETVRQRKLTVVFPEDWIRLQQEFIKAGVILDAFHAEFYVLNRAGEVSPRYTAPLILAPHTDSEGHTRSFLSIPLTLEALAESPHRATCVGYISSGQSLATAIDPYGRFYGDDKLTREDNLGRQIYIAQDPIDMLMLQTASYEHPDFKEGIYLACNGSLSVRDRAFRNVLKHARGDITILAHTRSKSPYDILTKFDGIPAVYRELLDLELRFKRQAEELDLSHVHLRGIMLKDSLARIRMLQFKNSAVHQSVDIEGSALVIDMVRNAGINVNFHTRTVHSTFRMLKALDTFIDSGAGAEIPHWKDLGEFCRDLRRHYRDLTANEQYRQMLTLDEFLQERYDLPLGTRLEDLVCGKAKRSRPYLPVRDSRFPNGETIGNASSYFQLVIAPGRLSR